MSQSDRVSAITPPQVIAGRFVISGDPSDLLGKGAMGEVFRGVDQQTGAPVAIKRLRSDLTANWKDTLERFEREGEALRRLSHPNVVRMLAALSEGEEHYIVMEYVGGGSLREQIEGQGRLPLRRVLSVGVELADALGRVHHLDIIHRDIKPDNVLLSEDGTPRLTDFGMAYLDSGKRVTAGGTIIGTLDYLSPEACAGQALDQRADIWSFGVVLFEMLTGEVPFRAETITATVGTIIGKPLPDVLALRPDAPEALAQLLSMMLEKEREKRIGSARRVAAELESLLAWLDEQASENTPLPGQLPSDPPPPSISREWPLPPSATGMAETLPIDTKSLPLERRNQLLLLQKVRSFWIEGVLHKVAPRKERANLSLEPADDAVSRPWEAMEAEPAEEEREDAPERRVLREIDEIYAEADRALLLLGPPGSGKTVSLLVLAQFLASAAEHDPGRPIPVVLSLASWAESREPLEEWAVKEMLSKYQIPRPLGREWLLSNSLVLLLDDLDVALLADAEGFHRALDQLREEHGLVGLAMACREEVYSSAGQRLKLGGAMRILAMDEEEVRASLTSESRRYNMLRNAIHNDPALMEMARLPLFLSIMKVVYARRGPDTSTLPSMTAIRSLLDEPTQRRRVLLDTYMKRMLKRGESGLYTREEITEHLRWLAQQMSAHSTRVFLIEQLQPSWLPTRGSKWLYMLLTRAYAGASAGLVVGVASAIVHALAPVHGLRLASRVANLLGWGVLPSSLATFTLLGGLVGVLLGLFDTYHFEQRRGTRQEGLFESRRSWLHVGVASTLSFLFFFWSQFPFETWVESLIEGTIAAVAFPVFLDYRREGQSYRTEIGIVESLSWSWSGGIAGLMVGAALGTVVGTGRYLQYGLTAGLTPGVAIALFFFLRGALRGGERLERANTPNQGILRSLRNSLTAAALFVPVLALTFYLGGGLQAAILSLFLVMPAALFMYGFLDVVKHFVVRLLLRVQLGVPFALSLLLEQTVTLALLRRVGGGYIFAQSMLQDHLAEADRGSPGRR